MLSLDAARIAVMNHLPPLRVIEKPLAQCVDFVLAEDVKADRDLPPYDRSTMDGFAVSDSDFENRDSLSLLGTLGAGDVSDAEVSKGAALRVMTGGVVPKGAGRVIPVECCETDGREVKIDWDSAGKATNIASRGEDCGKGEALLKRGSSLNPAKIAVCASVGKVSLNVFRRPKVAVISTGNEVVPHTETPESHQIRDCNTHLLGACCQRMGFECRILGIAPDNPQALREMVADGLGADVLLLSGGVSMGMFDFVPKILADEGVEKIFHKVRIKPGKPIWFGKTGRCAVFGLPGNPVSVHVNFKLFAEPFLLSSAGREITAETERPVLSADFENPFELDWLVNGNLAQNDGESVLTPNPINTSGDFSNAARTDGLFRCPPLASLRAGQKVDFVPWK